MNEYIKREDAKNAVTNHWLDSSRALERIMNIPAEDVGPVVHGRWEGVFQGGACSWSGKCSVCGVRNDIPHPIVAHYCPNCGAKMDG